MPYRSNGELPGRITQHLPEHAQDIYRAAFNHAWEEYADASKRRGQESQEEVAHKVAWAAVEKKYHKKGERWVAREEANAS